MTWDSLGRLTSVLPPSGSTPTATYTYDPLDRLRLADYGTAGRTRFRYVGLTTSVAQTVDDVGGSVIRSVGNSWTGEHLEDWVPGTPSSLRVYGTNGHNDTTWAAGSTGSVTGTARYDPWGTAASVTGSVPDFRFQGSWADGATGLSWAVTRWYAPAQGRFISEDSLLGEPRDPDSRHLYAYGEGEPVGRWDPDGRAWKSAWWNEPWTLVRSRHWNESSPFSKTIHLAAAATCLGISFVSFAAAIASAGGSIFLASAACDLIDLALVGPVVEIVDKKTEHFYNTYTTYDWAYAIYAIQYSHDIVREARVKDKYGRVATISERFNDWDTFVRFGNSKDWYTCWDHDENCGKAGWTLGVNYKFVASSTGPVRYAEYAYYSKDYLYQFPHGYVADPKQKLADQDSRYYQYGRSWHVGF